MKRIVLFVFCLLILAACSTPNSISNKIVIIVANDDKQVLTNTAEDLREDLNSVVSAEIDIVQVGESLPEASVYYLIGHQSQLVLSQYLSQDEKQYIDQHPASDRGGVIRKSQLRDKPLIILSGGETQGTQYMVYDYARDVLGIDPLAYWTGSAAIAKDFSTLTQFTNQTTAAPVVPYLIYFENDVDELANLKAPLLEYDWESFTNMVDSLVRMRYNGIEFFDMLGRVEFYTRPEYLEVHPDYQLNVEYLEKMIDYVHEKGMYVQIDMMMGRQLLTLSQEASECWTDYKQEWLDTWRTYLTDTPVKKADIFALRPRHQVWDWEYKSSCGEDKATVFNQVYAELGKLIDQYKSDAVKVCTCYHDGMEIFNQDFNPPEDWIIAWSDNGWADFDYLPEDTKGYRFGTYMHAGFWLNHDVFDPYPELIASTMNMMYSNFQATEYMMVNGQTFRPFMLNLEAFAESARLGVGFDGMQFYYQWMARYFGVEAAPLIVKAMQQLHAAHNNKVGYVEILWQIKNLQAYLADIPVRRPGREEFVVSRQSIEPWFDDTLPRIEHLHHGQDLAQQAWPLIEKNKVFFNDHIQLPMRLYLDLLNYNQVLIELVELKHQVAGPERETNLDAARKKLVEAQQLLAQLYETRQMGDQDPKWATWYDVKKRRPNNGFPKPEDLAQVKQAIHEKW